MERKDWIRPSPAEVMSTWELPDIVEQTSAVGPVDAFRLFMAYAERALHHDFERELGSAFHFEACNAKEIQPNKEGHWIPSAAIRERITQAVSGAIRGRMAPLLPAIHTYVDSRPNDPVTVNRLAWMAEQIEAIPYAMEGRALWRSREQPEGFPMDRKFEPMAWKELHDGLLAFMDETSAHHGKLKRGVNSQQIAPSFLDLLGEVNLAITLEAIEALGYRPKAAKGKASIIAAMDVALEYFAVPSPMTKHWPQMLNAQFPGIQAGTKAYPPVKAAQRTTSYKIARAAMLDRLKG